MAAPIRRLRLGPSDTVVEPLGGGVLLMRSPHALGDYPARLTARLEHWARVAPERTFIAKRGPDGAWRTLSYAETLAAARRIGQALLDRGLSAERPLAILSENDLEHALLGIAALHIGVPYAPISPAYSLLSTDFAKLKLVLGLLTPGLVFAADGQRFGRAIAACRLTVRSRSCRTTISSTRCSASPHSMSACLTRRSRRPTRCSRPTSPSSSTCSAC